jgi:predicted phosphodiesterase
MRRQLHIRAAGMLLLGLVAIPARAGDGSAQARPVYRFWSPSLGAHFYTLREAEKEKLQDLPPEVWTYEGIAFRAFASALADGLMPVYRFWSSSSGAHFYTLDEAERDKLLGTASNLWTYEGVAFYSYPAGHGPAGTLPVHRFWSGGLRNHFYTASDTERFKLVSSSPGAWEYEGVAWYAYPPEEVTAPTIIKGPFVQWIASDSATLAWQTRTAAGSAVQHGVGVAEGVTVSDPCAVTWHRMVLTGVEPGVVQVYRVASGLTSRMGTFRTAPRADQPFRFAVYGDSRTGIEAHRRLCAALARHGPDLVFHTGDLVSAGGNYGLWDTEFFGPAGDLMLGAPLIPVAGNHEYLGGGPPWFCYFFDRPLNEGWFALTYGNARFFGLDTNVDYTAGSPQYRWLVQELESAPARTAAWRIVILHHPPFTATVGHSDDAGVQSQLVPLFEQYGVDAVFAGHSHAYERYLYHGIQYIVTAGGGAPLYELTADLVPPVRQFGLSAHHYCVVDVDPEAATLTITALDLSGRVFDTVTLSKSAPD